MPTSRALSTLLVCAVAACHRPEGPSFEVTRLPETAYLAPDAAILVDAGASEGGPSGRGTAVRKPVMPANCSKPPAKAPNEDEASSDFPECLQYKNERFYLDPDKTRRVREKMGDDVCCYTAQRYDVE